MTTRDTRNRGRTYSHADPFKHLTWNDLQEWAGATIVSRGQGYQRTYQVQELARTSRGGLVAWV